jgi:hypothetical protein
MQTSLGNNSSKINENAQAAFRMKMAETIDRGLSATMSETKKELLYQEIILGYRVSTEKFLDDPAILRTCFDDIFGDSESGDVQRHIIEEMENSFDIGFSSENLNLSQAVSELQLKMSYR